MNILFVNGTVYDQANVCMQHFEFNNASQKRGHPYKLYKRHSYMFEPHTLLFVL